MAGARRLAWDAGRGLLADTPARKRFSQQTNILALLAGAAPAGQAKPLLDRILAMPRPSIQDAGRKGTGFEGVARASVYFRFYLSRALEALGEGERYLPDGRRLLEHIADPWALCREAARILAPGGRSASHVASRQMRASRTVSRSGTAARQSPSIGSVGRSLRLWTARSIRRSRSASSSSLVKAPFRFTFRGDLHALPSEALQYEVNLQHHDDVLAACRTIASYAAWSPCGW